MREENLLGSGMPKEAIRVKRMESYKDKALHGQHEKLTAGIRSSDSWEWFEEGDRGDVNGSPRSGVEDECYKEPHR